MRKKVTQTDLRQIARFGVVGVSNTIIDVGILNLLLWLYPTTNTWKTLGYNSLAIALGATNSFFLNKYWTFQRRNKITWAEIYRFIVLAGSTTLMNDLLLFLLSKGFPTLMSSGQLGANILKLASIIGTMSVSFFGMRLWVFFHKLRASDAPSIADQETLKLPVVNLVYDITIMVGGVLRPIYEVDTMVMPAVAKSESELTIAENA